VIADRRALVFVGFAIVCFLLVAVCPAEFRSVAVVTGITYLVLAVASALDARSRSRL
jgi:hypothetical protein